MPPRGRPAIASPVVYLMNVIQAERDGQPRKHFE